VFSESDRLTLKRNITTPAPISQVIAQAVSHVVCAPEYHHRPEYIPSNARKAAALKLTATYRVYVLLQHLNRYRYRGRGKFVLTGQDTHQLSQWLNLSPIRVERLIKQMAKEGVFLRSPCAAFPYISLVSRKEVNIRLSRLSQEKNLPDFDEVSYRKEVLEFEDFSGLQMFSAQTFNGWLRVSKHAKKRLRWGDLERLWCRTRPALEAWINRANIRKIHNYARTDGPGPSPDDIHVWHHQVRGRVYVCWQRANTYVPEGLTKQANRGVCRNAAAEMCDRHPELCGESIARIRTNWPYIGLPRDKRVRAFKRMQRGIREHPDRTHYRHVSNYVSRWTGRSYQTWLCEHAAVDKDLERELYLQEISRTKSFSI
jgi:hypothetical protein